MGSRPSLVLQSIILANFLFKSKTLRTIHLSVPDELLQLIKGDSPAEKGEAGDLGKLVGLIKLGEFRFNGQFQHRGA